jgi:hypothetical protein
MKDRCLAAVVLVAVTLSVLTIGGARAHDRNHPELNDWFKSLQSGEGLCCSGSEAKRLDDADWESKDGHYRVRIDGEWVDVPQDAVVDGPNRAGRTMVWPSKSAVFYAGEHELILCGRGDHLKGSQALNGCRRTRAILMTAKGARMFFIGGASLGGGATGVRRQSLLPAGLNL